MSSRPDSALRTGRPRRIVRRAAFGAGAGLLALTLAGAAHAQAMPDLNLRALGWLRGRWASPVVCEKGGDFIPTAHRLVVAPGPKHVQPPVARITFHGIDLEGPSRCSGALGGDARDLRGSLLVTLPGMSRPDMAQAEFQRRLRQVGGFDFDVLSGQLRIADWGDGVEPRVVDFAGGVLRVREARRGSDAARVLADIPSPRKITFELESAGDDDDPGGRETLAFPLAFYDFR